MQLHSKPSESTQRFRAARLQLPKVGDAVADDLVHRRADRLGEVVVVERGGVGLALNRCLVYLRRDGRRGSTARGLGGLRAGAEWSEREKAGRWAAAYYAVDFVGGDPGPDDGRSAVEDLTCQPTDGPEAVDLLR